MWKRIDEKISISKKLMKVSHLAFRVWAYVLPHTDIAGRFLKDLVKSQCLPYFSLRLEQVDRALSELDVAGLIHMYDVSGKQYMAYHDHDDWNGLSNLKNIRTKWPSPPDKLCDCLDLTEEGQVLNAVPNGERTRNRNRTREETSSLPAHGEGDEDNPYRPNALHRLNSRDKALLDSLAEIHIGATDMEAAAKAFPQIPRITENDVALYKLVCEHYIKTGVWDPKDIKHLPKLSTIIKDKRWTDRIPEPKKKPDWAAAADAKRQQQVADIKERERIQTKIELLKPKNQETIARMAKTYGCKNPLDKGDSDD